MNIMTSSYTTSFTLTHAKYLASKVAADLRQMNLFYGRPSEKMIVDCALENAILLLHGCLDSVEYGFKRDGYSIIAVRYRAVHGVVTADERSGGVPSGVDVEGASWYSFLWFSTKWDELTPDEREKIEGQLPFVRGDGPEPVTGAGSWTADRSYSSENVSLRRSTFK